MRKHHAFLIITLLLTMWVRSHKQPTEPLKVIIPKETSACVAVREATGELKEPLQAQYPKCKE